MSFFQLVKPKLIPPLEVEFRPASLANRAFLAEAETQSEPLIFGLERENGKISRFETYVFPEKHPRAGANLYYAERLLKFLLWQRGGFKVYVAVRAASDNIFKKYTLLVECENSIFTSWASRSMSSHLQS